MNMAMGRKTAYGADHCAPLVLNTLGSAVHFAQALVDSCSLHRLKSVYWHAGTAEQ